MDIYRELMPKIRPGIWYPEQQVQWLNIPDWLLPLSLCVAMIAVAVVWGIA